MTHNSVDNPVARLLVVDDDTLQGTIISRVGSQCGFVVQTVATFEAALKLLELQTFDCVTVDLVLGERDGIELLRTISELATYPQVVVISGCEERILGATVRMARDLGMRDAICLSKPLDFNLLRKALACQSPARRGRRPGSQRVAEPGAAHFTLALQNHEIFPVFQPKVKISTGKLIGCEALARWNSPDFGFVNPDIFIPLAERGNHIKSLTMTLIEDSIQSAKEFLCRDPAFVLAVNLSANLLSDVALPDEIESLLQKHGFPGSSLMLEVTESVAMSNVSLAMNILLRLRIRGIGISMDDFGTGYSSLAVLARMPFTEIKIDRSFVTNCLHDQDIWKIVRGAIALGHEFKLKVVAEGVEDQRTWQALDRVGCDIGQGYYFSAALSSVEFTAWSQHWDRGPNDKEAA